MDPTSIFISYSYDEVNEDELRLHYFVNELRLAIDDDKNFNVLVDYERIKAGTNINNFITKAAEESAVVIVLLSPEYKNKVENKKKHVYNEFNIIYQRFLECEENNTIDKYFLILPVTFIGSFDNVKLDELSALRTIDFSGMYVTNKYGEIEVPNQIRSTYKQYFREFAERIRAIRTFHSKEFEREQNYFFKFLFKDTKSEWHKKESHKYIDDIFVKTSIYLNVRDENVRFIIGRKGSGKSTITHILPVLEQRHFSFTIPIIANDIYIETCYNLFSSKPSFDSDTENVLRRSDVLKYIWDVFFHLSFLYNFIINNKDLWQDPRINHLKKYIFDLLNWQEENWSKIHTPNSKNYNAIFEHTYQKMYEFVETLIYVSFNRVDKLSAEIINRFHIENFREFVFTKDILNSLYNTIGTTKKKVLLSLDGFDTAFELFRHHAIINNAQDLNQRATFERNWLLAMVLLIHDKGLTETTRNELYKKFHYCITIPYDRYIEMKELDRDAYRNRNDFISLRWSGLELSALIRKRLIEYKRKLGENVTDDKTLPIEERFRVVMERYFPEIPSEIEIEYNKVTYKIPLYIYILRHSFWRPRDVLYYYGNLLAASKSRTFKNRGKKLDNYYVRQIVKQTTRSVINDEFISEFKTMCSNFEEVLQLFYRSKQIILWNDLSAILNKLDFSLVAGDIDEFTVNERIEFLYKIGFIGVVVPNEIQKKDDVYKYAFIFNEDTFLFDVITRKRYTECSFIIHPIFCEFLQLDISENEEMVLNFSWEYLVNNELYRDMNPTIK